MNTNELSFLVLTALADGPRHGYAILRDVEAITDAHGTVTDCGDAPGTCVVASVYIHGFQGLATAPLAFG